MDVRRCLLRAAPTVVKTVVSRRRASSTRRLRARAHTVTLSAGVVVRYRPFVPGKLQLEGLCAHLALGVDILGIVGLATDLRVNTTPRHALAP